MLFRRQRKPGVFANTEIKLVLPNSWFDGETQELSQYSGLEQIFSEHRERLKRMVAFRLDPLLKRRVDESDVIQDAFVEACRKFDQYKLNPQIPIFLWLRLIACETLIDVHRHHLGVQARDPRREHHESASFVNQTSAISLANQLVGDFTPAIVTMTREEVLQRLRCVLEELEPIDREIIALRHGEQLSRHEVAAVLNISLGTAAKRYVRALSRCERGWSRPMIEESESQTRYEAMDELAEIYLQRRRAGEPLSIDAFAELHADYADEIRRVFPTLLQIEQLGQCQPSQLLSTHGSPKTGVRNRRMRRSSRAVLSANIAL